MRRNKTAPSLAQIRDLGTVDVWHPTRPDAADVLGISRDLAYAMAKSGDLPTIRLGRRLVVPVPALRKMLGDLPPEAVAATSGADATGRTA